MSKRLQTLHIIKRAATYRIRQLLDALGMLVALLPGFRDSFDSDELPLEFILKRDSRGEPVGRPLRPEQAPVNATIGRMSARGPEHRGGLRKQIPDD
jgi:hypothetical protein